MDLKTAVQKAAFKHDQDLTPSQCDFRLLHLSIHSPPSFLLSPPVFLTSSTPITTVENPIFFTITTSIHLMNLLFILIYTLADVMIR